MLRGAIINAFDLVLLVAALNVSCEISFDVNYQERLEDMSLEGETYLNLTDTPTFTCFSHCSQDCRCMTFQMFKNTECQLLASTRFQKPSKFIPIEGYTYYEMKHSWQRCTDDITCCMTSSPCLNGATCQPTSTSDHSTTRFRCICPRHFIGQRCQYATSCRGYNNGTNKNGLYKIIDSNTSEVFTVFCDFDPHSKISWTLVTSYSFKNLAHFRLPFFTDDPVNEYNVSWSSFRLSKSKMESIQRNSARWRMTCEFPVTANPALTDFVHVLMTAANPITFNYPAAKCVRVKYIIVRGTSCSNCTAPVIQNNQYPLHFDNNPFSWTPCDFRTDNPKTCTEDNFGWYGCANPIHRCSSSPEATTQMWFGGQY